MVTTRLLLPALFALLVAWFRLSDPYGSYLEQATSFQLVGYHAGRLVFAGFFALIVLGAGTLALKGWQRRFALPELCPLDDLIAKLLVGLAVIRLGMLVLGFASLYTLWVLLPLALVCLWHVRIPRVPLDTWKSETLAEKSLLAVAAFTALAAGGMLLAEKLFFPLADPDYLDHYFTYYTRVVEEGTLWPVHAWHHFYDAKGGSEIFLAVALSDATAPFAVNMLMVVLSLVLTWRITRYASGDALCAWVACAVAASAFLPVVPGVAEFCKQHIIGGTLLLGLVWTSQQSFKADSQAHRFWCAMFMVQAFAIALFRPTFAAIACIYCAMMLIYMLMTRRHDQALAHAYAKLACIGGVALVLGFNQLTTGLADATPFRLFYPFADQARIAHWFSPFWLLLWDLGSTMQHGSVALPGFERLQAMLHLIRAEDAKVYGLLGVAVWLVVLWQLAKKRKDMAGIACILALLAAAAGAGLFIRQDISLARAYIFCAFAVAALGAVGFGLLRTFYAHIVWLRMGAGSALTALGLLAAWQGFDSIPNRHWRDVAMLASRQLPMGDLYARDYPHFADYEQTCRFVPDGARVWTSRYMPVTTCRVENFFYFSMGPNWHTVMFGSPQHAKEALQLEGLNYFLIDTNEPFFDLLPYAPLFQPHEIGQHFAALWEQNGVYLLTWKSPEILPLPPQFLPAYAESVSRALKAADFPVIHAEMNATYLEWRKTLAWPVVVDPRRPRPRGWQ